MNKLEQVYCNDSEKIRKELELYVVYEQQQVEEGLITHEQFTRLIDIVTYTLYLMDTKKPLYVPQKGIFVDEAI